MRNTLHFIWPLMYFMRCQQNTWNETTFNRRNGNVARKIPRIGSKSHLHSELLCAYDTWTTSVDFFSIDRHRERRATRQSYFLIFHLSALLIAKKCCRYWVKIIHVEKWRGVERREGEGNEKKREERGGFGFVLVLLSLAFREPAHYFTTLALCIERHLLRIHVEIAWKLFPE